MTLGLQLPFRPDIGCRSPSGQPSRQNWLRSESKTSCNGTATYTPDALNPYTTITQPGFLEIYGKAPITQAVTVNALATTRQGRDFRKELTFPNTNQRWESITTNGGSVSTSQHHLPAASTTPTYDLDGNQTSDGQWTYTWDAENRLTSI